MTATDDRQPPASLIALYSMPSHLVARVADVLGDAWSSGQHAAAWIRSLAAPDAPALDPLHQLADAVQEAMGSLNPTDTATRNPESGAITPGLGGVSAELRSRLREPAAFLSGELTPDQAVRVLAVVSATLLAADLHGYGDYHDDLPTLLAVIDHAIGPRPEQPAP